MMDENGTRRYLSIVLVVLLLSCLVVAFDEVSVCSFEASLIADTASSMADCSRRNTVVNTLLKAEDRIRYHVGGILRRSDALRFDPFPEIFSAADVVDSFKRYREFKKKVPYKREEKAKIVDKKKKRQQEMDPEDECIDITKYSTVIDFSCCYLWPSAVFHHTFECLMGNYDLFKEAQNHDNNSTILIVPYEITQYHGTNLMPFVDFFVPNGSRKADVVTHRYMKIAADVPYRLAHQNLDCFIVNSKAKILYTNLKTLWLDYYSFDQFPPTHPQVIHMMKTAQRFQNAIQTTTKSLDLQKSTCRTILFIHRSKNRIVSNSDAIIQAINDAVSSTQLHGQLRTTIFYGNETFTDTVLLFQQAAVVVAFHGAGLINTIYCPSDAVIVELSITPSKSDPKSNSTEIWRSNHVIGTLCRLHWVTYLLCSTNSLFRQDKEKLGYLFQTRLHTITISKTDISRIATIIKNKILSIFSKSSSSLSSSVVPISQGSYEEFTSKALDTITPVNMFDEPDNNPSKQGASKLSVKGNNYLDHDGPPIVRKRSGEKRGRKSRKEKILQDSNE